MKNLTGCPCGCISKLPYLDDPECARNRQWRDGLDQDAESEGFE